MIGRLGKLALWRPLGIGRFRRLFLGESLALLADQMFLITLTLLVLRVAGPGAELAGVLAVASVPGAALMLAGGLVADRFPPAAVLAISNAGRATLMAALAAIVLSDATELWHLYVFAGALGLLDAFHYPAALSVVPSVVEKERLGAANALLQGAEQAAGFVGPALAAAAAASIGLGASLGAYALMFAATGAIVFSVVRRTSRGAGGPGGEGAPARPSSESATSGVGAISEGVRYAWRDPLIRTMLLVLAAINLAAIGPVVVGGAVLAQERLGGAGSLGILFSAFGAGSLAGLLAAGSFARPRRRGLTMLAATALIGLGLGLLGFAQGLLVACGLAAIMGVGSGYLGVVLVSWLQEWVEPDLRGRVMSLVVFCSVALDPVSYALAGVLVGVSLPAVFVSAGVLMGLAALLGCMSKTVRRFD